MRIKRVLLAVAGMVGITVTVGAQPAPSPDDYETWLLPVSESARPGAFGAIWATKTWIAYTPTSELDYVGVGPFNSCQSLCGTIREITADPPWEPPVVTSLATDPPGQLFWVERTKAVRVWMKLRVQDLSQATPMRVGVEIPVVREADYYVGGRIVLLNLPNDSQFRHWLRIYDIDRKAGTSFRVVGRRQVTGEQLFETTVTATIVPDKYWTPGAVSLDLRALLPRETGTTSFLEITPSDPTIHYWAFATVTSNETQEIVTVTP